VKLDQRLHSSVAERTVTHQGEEGEVQDGDGRRDGGVAVVVSGRRRLRVVDGSVGGGGGREEAQKPLTVYLLASEAVNLGV
jgi:hypothetical protein